MSNDAQLASPPHLLFTAPWEPVVVRRGDALGLRALADQLAEAVAPDLSNRVRDGRWITILAWSLVRSQGVFHASGGREISSRAQQQQRYAWLRPLELMWVARSLKLSKPAERRSLAGIRRVQQWDKNGRREARFSMSADQFRAYRQTGMYGGYRLAFRTWPGMTDGGNGWTPGKPTRQLAEWLDERLGKTARPRWSLHGATGDAHQISSRSVKRNVGKEDEWWRNNWAHFDHPSRDYDFSTLPRGVDDFRKLPEAHLLAPLTFGHDANGKRRRAVVHRIARSSATDHLQLCEHLAEEFSSDQTIALLPRFSRLADAGMAAMDFIAQELHGKPRLTLDHLASRPEAHKICRELKDAAAHWLHGRMASLPHIETANFFARKFSNARPSECLCALLNYHDTYGGGLRWFVLRDSIIEPRTPPGSGSSRYRFRLWSLCRLAAQCGVLRAMPAVLRQDSAPDEDETNE